MKPKIEFSDAELQKAFTEMSPKTFRTAVKAGMRRSLNIIKRKAVANYKAAYPGSDRYKYIHAKVYRTGTGAMIDLLFLKDDDKEMRPWGMRLQNKGTAMRATRKGYDRGFMSASEFFTEAVESTKSKAQNELMRNVNEAVVKKARKLGLT
jgi:hypothetical protein